MTGLPLTGEEGEAAAPRQGRRPKVESPKVHIGFRLDADLVKAIKATGKGYNVRVEKVLCGALARGELNADRDLFDARLGGPERMTWNYRVIRHKEGHLALHEVYYNEAGQPRAYSQQPVTFIGDGDDALQELIGARKHAMRVLRGGAANRRSAPRPERRLYDEAVSEALIVLWEASDRVCGKRLKALAPILVRRWSGTGISSLLPRSARVCWG